MTSDLFAPGRRLPLLIALGALFLLYPLAVELDRVRLFRFVFVGVLVLAAYSVGGSRRNLVVALALGLPAVLAQLFAYAAPEGLPLAFAAGSGLLFLGYVTVVVMRSVLAAGPVTGDKIAGAISAYLLLGLIWAIAYGFLEVLTPGSFRTPDDLALAPGSRTEYAFIYYSFVTLTTLGYGEITPATHWSQTLAWFEAVMGQLFLAILIARLVGLHIQHSTESD